MRSFLTFSCWGIWCLSTTWLALFLITGERFLPVRLVSYLAPWLAIALVFCLITAIMLKKPALASCSFLTMAVISLPFIGQFVPSRNAPENGTAVYKIMTYNKMGRNRDIEAVASVIQKEKPDLLFMQEISETDSAILLTLLQKIYDDDTPYYAYVDGLTISRFELKPVEGSKEGLTSIDVAFPEATVKTWNVHLPKSFSSTVDQYEATDELAQQIELYEGPIIVAGDFNATQLNYPYVKVANQLTNAFEIAGTGLGFTFPSRARRIGSIVPFMRIDHIFYSGHFKGLDCFSVKNTGGSDHFPIVAQLTLQQ